MQNRPHAVHDEHVNAKEIQRKRPFRVLEFPRLPFSFLRADALFILYLRYFARRACCPCLSCIFILNRLIAVRVKNSIERGCRFFSCRAWAARFVYGSALFSNITSTTGSEGRRTQEKERERDSIGSRTVKFPSRGKSGAEGDGYGREREREKGGSVSSGVKQTRGTRRLGLRNSLIDRALSRLESRLKGSRALL